MRHYCQACNQPTEYSVNPPSFCSSCGAQFNKATGASVKVNRPVLAPKPRPAPIPVIGDDDDDDNGQDSVASIPEITGLDVEIEQPRQRGEKFGDIVASAPREKGPLRQPQKVSRKKFLEQFKQEAGTLRPKG